MPESVSAPAPAPHASTGRRLQAEAAVAEAPAPSKLAPLPGPQPSAKRPIGGHIPAQMEAPAPAPEPARKGRGSNVPDFFQCGGMGDACPLTNRDLCVDGQYLDCARTAHCVRQSKW